MKMQTAIFLSYLLLAFIASVMAEADNEAPIPSQGAVLGKLIIIIVASIKNIFHDMYRS